MENNGLIKNLIEEYMNQRSALNKELMMIDFNSMNFLESRITIENAINTIDLKIDNLLINHLKIAE